MDPDRRLGLDLAEVWPVLIAIGVVPLVFLDAQITRLGVVGGLLSLSGVVLSQLAYWGPGLEEAALALASFGAGLVVAAGLNSFSVESLKLMAILPSAAILVLSLGVISNGRLGLPEGELNERFDFASTLADEHGPGRILVASTSREDIPGEARPGPGFWYRLIDGEQMTLDEVWLPERLDGDRALLQAMETMSTGSDLRPGERLAPFAVDWIVLLGPEFRLDEVLVAQLDLVPTPLDPESRVYENPGARPLAESEGDSTWTRSGTGFVGEPGPGRVTLAVNYDGGWSPDAQPVTWQMSVGASSGGAEFTGPDLNLGLAWGTAGLLLAAVGLMVVGRIRR